MLDLGGDLAASLGPWWLLAFGVISVGVGGDIFERSLVAIAGEFRIPRAITGMTIAAFATSSPEASVGIFSAIAGSPEVALGDSLGSNVVNLGVALGLIAAIWTVRSSEDLSKLDFGLLLTTPLLLLMLGADGALSRIEGAVLLGCFALWLALTIQRTLQRRDQRQALQRPFGKLWSATFLVVGCGLLVIAGRLIVTAAKGISADYGLDLFFTGATMVALGTSAPEITTTLISQIRGRGEIGFGTLIGSNLFNALFIIGMASVIHPIQVIQTEFAIALAFGALGVVLAWPFGRPAVTRAQGLLLVGAYVAYLSVLMASR